MCSPLRSSKKLSAFTPRWTLGQVHFTYIERFNRGSYPRETITPRGDLKNCRAINYNCIIPLNGCPVRLVPLSFWYCLDGYVLIPKIMFRKPRQQREKRQKHLFLVWRILTTLEDKEMHQRFQVFSPLEDFIKGGIGLDYFLTTTCRQQMKRLMHHLISRSNNEFVTRNENIIWKYHQEKNEIGCSLRVNKWLKEWIYRHPETREGHNQTELRDGPLRTPIHSELEVKLMPRKSIRSRVFKGKPEIQARRISDGD
jgi:hypothetical protein